ncbi:Core trichothecene cluster (CTC) protein 15 [Paramyrothecium foliicola]|nr:Core trichothecene cluster (CTC) protein 15 [Paramyrothecium foliicola]
MDNLVLLCRICDMRFDTPQEKREHAKSEWHVYKLRCKYAPEGTVVTPPSEVSKQDDSRYRHQSWASSDESELSGVEDLDVTDSDDENEIEGQSFDPEECLFCNKSQGSLESNVAHMQKDHSFIIPYQSSLAVDLETLIWYLHFVIHNYNECILCAKRYGSVEAVQQHMTAKGHCRLELSSEIAEFYEGSKSNSDVEEAFVQPDQASMRLPSGKLLTHRSYLQSSGTPRQLKRPESNNAQSLPSSRPKQESTELLNTRDKKSSSFETQLARLSLNDQRSLAHLTPPEQRSALASMKKQLSKAQREERRAQLKLESMGNKTLSKNYRADNPGRLNGKNALMVILKFWVFRRPLSTLNASCARELVENATMTFGFIFFVLDHPDDIQTINALNHVRTLKSVNEAPDDSAKFGIGWSD